MTPEFTPEERDHLATKFGILQLGHERYWAIMMRNARPPRTRELNEADVKRHARDPVVQKLLAIYVAEKLTRWQA